MYVICVCIFIYDFVWLDLDGWMDWTERMKYMGWADGMKKGKTVFMLMLIIFWVNMYTYDGIYA